MKRRRFLRNTVMAGGVLAMTPVAAAIQVSIGEDYSYSPKGMIRWSTDRDDEIARIVQKVLSSDEQGLFVPDSLAEEFIQALRDRALIRQANSSIRLDLLEGNLRVPRIPESVLDDIS